MTQSQAIVGTAVLFLFVTVAAFDHALAAGRFSEAQTRGKGEAGRKLFNGKGFCYQCHGQDAYVDRLPAMSSEMRATINQMVPKPADFQNPATLKLQNDEERFKMIRDGHPGTAMFSHEYLEDDEIREILAYLAQVRSDGNKKH